MNIRKAKLRVTMSDGSKWDIPVSVIAKHRADYYKHEFDNDIGRSLEEDTWPFFEQYSCDIEDWAENNMDWTDVAAKAVRVRDSDDIDYQEGWVNGDKEIVE